VVGTFGGARRSGRAPDALSFRTVAATDVLLAAALASDPAGPLVTFYDDASGERVELSAATLANWVAKTANLLQDDVGLLPGDRVAVLLPAHWQAAAVLLGAWSAGAVVTVDVTGAVAAFTDARRAAAAAAVPEVFALSLASLGRGFDAGLPPGARDYVVEVRAHGDRFAPRSPVPDDAPALDLDGMVSTGADLVEIARRRAAELGLFDHDRLLSTLPWEEPADWVDGLLVPLAARATLVLCAHTDPEALVRRVSAEHVTATLGATVPGIRPL
jgi:uncharacterized protein (TIGR03089 family)